MESETFFWILLTHMAFIKAITMPVLPCPETSEVICPRHELTIQNEPLAKVP